MTVTEVTVAEGPRKLRGPSPDTSSLESRLTPYWFLAPGYLLFAVFMIYPLVKALQISFYDWNIVPGADSTFVGFGNYRRAFADPIAWVSMRNTLLYTVLTVPAQMALAMGAALLLNTITRAHAFFRTLYYLPVITSWVIVSLLFRYLFQFPNGFINYLLVDVTGLVATPVAWLQHPETAALPILALGVWKGIGWSMLIYLAALKTIPQELYEVAAIDGAGSWRRFRAVTLPMIRPTVVFTLVMLVIGGFNVFISVFLITGGGPRQQTEVILSYMYHQAFDFLNLGYGAALSFVLAAVIFVISFVQIRYLRERREAL